MQQLQRRCGPDCVVDQDTLLLGRELPLHGTCTKAISVVLMWADQCYLQVEPSGRVNLLQPFGGPHSSYATMGEALDPLTELLSHMYHLE